MCPAPDNPDIADLQGQVSDLQGAVADLRESPPTDGFSETQVIVNNDDSVEVVEPFNEGDALQQIEELVEEGELLPIAEKGDLIVGDKDGLPAVLPLGEDGQVLTVDTSKPLGMFWDGPTTPPEDNNGEELDAELSSWVTVSSVVQSVPDDNVSSISTDYTPPEDTDLLVVFWVRWEPSKSASHPKPELAGAGAPDYEEISTLFTGGRFMGMRAWKNPPSGELSCGLDPNTTSLLMIPISVKGQGGEPLIVDKIADRETPDSISLTQPSLNLTFPGIALVAYCCYQQSEGKSEFTPERVGTRVLAKKNDASGAVGTRTFEANVAAIGSEAVGVGVTPPEGAEGDNCLAVGICEQEAA